jgi:hypothetical protein
LVVKRYRFSRFFKPHLGLRQEIMDKNKKYQNQTTAMFAGITDHIWTMPEEVAV